MSEALNPREQEILRLIADGLSNGEIAAKLFLTEGTVKWYNTQIFGKLGVKNRVEAIRAAREPKPSSTPASEPDVFGRVRETNDVIELLLADGSRLVTILGPGGIGKTTLAQKVASSAKQHFSDGVKEVSLVAFTDGEQIAPAIADAIELRAVSETPLISQLLAHLAGKHMLIVLDNVEQLTDGAMHIKALLEGGLALRLLVTSRERLNLQAERAYRLEGLPMPSDAPTQDEEAIALFIRHARQANPALMLDDVAISAIARICRLVHGMPLAIVLAAASADAFSLQEIGNEVARSMDVLATELNDMPARHRSMRGVLDATWGRLTAVEQEAFSKLSLFRGGFNREAALAVTGMHVRTLASLHNKALVRNNGGRYSIHELLRQYAEVRSLQSQSLRLQYARYYLETLTTTMFRVAEENAVAATSIEPDFENIRQAWQIACEQGLTGMLGTSHTALMKFCKLHGRMGDASTLLTNAIRCTSDMALVRRLRESRVTAYQAIGAYVSDLEDSEIILQSATLGGDQRKAIWALNRQGYSLRRLARYQEGKSVLGESLRLCEAVGDSRLSADTLCHLGMIHYSLGETVQALELFERATKLVLDFGMRDIVAVQAFTGLAHVHLDLSKIDTAIDWYGKALQLAQATHESFFEFEGYNMIGHCHGFTGKQLFAQSIAYFQQAHLVAIRTQMSHEQGWADMGLCQAYRHLGDYSKALDFATQARARARIGNNTMLELVTSEVEGSLFQQLGLLEQALERHDTSERLLKSIDSSYILPRVVAMKVVDQIRLKRIDNDWHALLESIRTHEVANQRHVYISEVINAICEFYFHKRQFTACVGLAIESISLCRSTMRYANLACALIWHGRALVELGSHEAGMAANMEALALATRNGYHRIQIDARRALQHACDAVSDTIGFAKHRSAAEALIAEIRENLKDRPDLLQGLHLL